MNAIRALETGWTVQLNGDATFGFCRAAVDMIGLGFCAMGGANHPACWSLIPHQTEGELMYTVSFRETKQAALALFSANLDKTQIYYMPQASDCSAAGYSIRRFPELPESPSTHRPSPM